MDIDTISYKPYINLLNYDIVLGVQEENYGKDNLTLYCNAILLCKKNNLFIKEWIDNYEKYFDNESWCESSIHLLSKLVSDNLNNSNNTFKNYKILEKECFFYPSYNETYKIFEGNEDINNNLITLHYWNSYSNKYYNNIKDFDYIKNNNSMYCKIAKNLLYNEKNISYF